MKTKNIVLLAIAVLLSLALFAQTAEPQKETTKLVLFTPT